MRIIYKCDDCGNDNNLGGLNLTCYGQTLCKECLNIFMQEQEDFEVNNGRH